MSERPALQDLVNVLNASFIKANVPMIRAIELMETAFRMLSDQMAYVPQRVVMNTPDNSMSVFFKPAFLSEYDRMSIKILTQIRENEDPLVPTIKGMVMLIDMKSGAMLSLSDGNYTTALRTGAASGIATSWLANPDASSLALFGCGAQGRTQVEAVLAVRPIKRIYLFDLNEKSALSLASDLASVSDIIATVNPDRAVLKEVDVICTATQSGTPLFTLDQIKRGVHINAVGSYCPNMQELDPEIMREGLIFLDDEPACLHDSGDLLVPLKMGFLDQGQVRGELGALFAGSISGRKENTDITIFKTVGNAIQDFFIANEAYEKSLVHKSGQWIDFTS